MRAFKEFPEESICPICKTNNNKECVLIGIVGTEKEDDRLMHAQCFHLECIELLYDKSKKDMDIIYQVIKK